MKMNHNLQKRCNEIEYKIIQLYPNMLLKKCYIDFQILPNTKYNYPPFDKMEEECSILVCILIMK